MINLQFYRRNKSVGVYKIAVFLTFSFVVFNVFSQEKFSNEFLKIGVGASEMAQGGAVVARTDNEAAGYWNPSGLLNTTDQWSVSAMHAEYFAGIAQYDYASGHYRLNDSLVIGASFIRFGVDDIPNTTNLVDDQGNFDYNRITTFSQADYAFLFHIASPLFIENLKVGATAKVIYRQFGKLAQAYGFGFDVGAQYQVGKWQLGAVARDVTSTFNAWMFSLDDSTQAGLLRSGNELPENDLEITLPSLVIGGARTFTFGEHVNLGVEANLIITTDGERNTLIRTSVASIDPALGIETSYKNRVFLRLGANNIIRESSGVIEPNTSVQPNLGLGLRIGKWYVDYALTNIGGANGLQYSNLFTLTYRMPSVNTGAF